MINAEWIGRFLDLNDILCGFLDYTTLEVFPVDRPTHVRQSVHRVLLTFPTKQVMEADFHK